MSQATAIEWTDVTWNPVHGCSIVSTECKHCYAMELSLRYGQTSKPWTPANAAENVILKPHKLREPLSNAKEWRGLGAAAAAAGKTEGKLVFVNSTSDLFHEQVPAEYIERVWDVMERCPQHTFQILTKRPERMRTAMLNRREYLGAEPLPNVWLGVSVGLRHFIRRADVLRETPAAVRFISAEPLLGPLVHDSVRVAAGREMANFPQSRWSDGSAAPELDLTGIDWLIVGGESGPKHRPMDVQWARDLRDAALRRYWGDLTMTVEDKPLGEPVYGEAYRTAFFMKQMGGARPGGALESLPEDLRIREMPQARRYSDGRLDRAGSR